MTHSLRASLGCLVLFLAMVGCGSPPPPASPEATEQGPSSADAAAATADDSAAVQADSASSSRAKATASGGKSASAAAKSKDERLPFKFGDLIEPFTPPPLEELERSVTWVERPVLDALKLLREKQAREKPLVSLAEALRMRNQSDNDNRKILSALGRLPASDDDVNWDAVINRHAYGDVNSTNPILASSVIEFDIAGLIGFGLFSFDADFNPFASSDTVVSWHTSKDGLYDKVVMRRDLTWSDGHPITAHDVVFSFQAIMTSAIPVPAQRSGTDKLKWVHAYDDYTLVFFHKEPYAINVWNLNFSVIPKHIYEPHLAKDPTLVNDPYFVELENRPISGGAYVIRSRTRSQEVVLERREDYYLHNGKQVRDKPFFKTIRFRIRPDLSTALLALKAGDIDELQLAPEQWRYQTNDDAFYRTNTKVHGVEWTEFHFLWNCGQPPFDDVRVRKAMSYAMDYKELLTNLRYGLDAPCNGVFHPTSRWAPKPPLPFYQQDLDQAEALLEEAGWVDSDGDGVRDKVIGGQRVPLEFTILTVNKQDRVDICTLLKDCLDQIQVKCHVKPLEFPTVIAKLQAHDFQAAFGGWGTGTDPYTLENIFKTGEQRNYGQYSNPEVDRLFEEGLRELDPQRREKIYARIATLLYEDQPYTWLFYQNSFYGFNKSLRGYNFSPRGPYHYSPGFASIWKPLTL